MKEKNNKGLKWLIIILIILIFGLIGFIIYDKNIIKFEKIKTTQTTKQTNEKIEKLIAEYNLENIREKIYSDEEFFLDFSKVVLENENISNYREYVFKIFEILIDNKENIDKEYFLHNLKLLSITKVDYIEIETANGIYIDETKQIEYIVSNNANSIQTIYHELLHFIDHNIHKDNYKEFHVCKNLYTNNYEETLYSESCYSYYDNYVYLFTEGGAEKYSTNYFNNKITDSYQYEVNVLSILSYIFGEESIKNIFFSNNRVYELYKLLCIENGVSNSDFNQIMNIINDSDFVNERDIVDILIDLYYIKNKTKWYENKNFYEMIHTLTYSIEDYNTKYKDEYKTFIKRNAMDKELDDYIFKLEQKSEKYQKTEGTVSSNGHFSIIDYKVYYIHHIFYEDFKDEIFKINVDFETLSINNYELIEIDS